MQQDDTSRTMTLMIGRLTTTDVQDAVNAVDGLLSASFREHQLPHLDVFLCLLVARRRVRLRPQAQVRPQPVLAPLGLWRPWHPARQQIDPLPAPQVCLGVARQGSNTDVAEPVDNLLQAL